MATQCTTTAAAGPPETAHRQAGCHATLCIPRLLKGRIVRARCDSRSTPLPLFLPFKAFVPLFLVPAVNAHTVAGKRRNEPAQRRRTGGCAAGNTALGFSYSDSISSSSASSNLSSKPSASARRRRKCASKADYQCAWDRSGHIEDWLMGRALALTTGTTRCCAQYSRLRVHTGYSNLPRPQPQPTDRME